MTDVSTVGQNSRNGNGRGASAYPFLVIICVLLAFMISLLMGFVLEPKDAGFLARAALVTLSVVCGTPIGALGGAIGNILLKFTRPDMILTRGGIGTILKTKLFWTVGPQLIGTVIGTVVGVSLTAGILSQKLVVRRDPVRNQKASESVLLDFAESSELSQVPAILDHPNCTGKVADVFIQRLQDEAGAEGVATYGQLVVDRDDLSRKTLETIAKSGSLSVLRSPQCTPEVELLALKTALSLASDKVLTGDARREIERVAKSTTSHDELLLIAEAGFSCIANNPNATDDILSTAVTKTEDVPDLSVFMDNPNFGAKSLLEAAKRVGTVKKLDLERPLRAGEYHVPLGVDAGQSLLILKHPLTDESVLRALAARGSANVLLHPKCTGEIVKELAEAGNPYITFSQFVTPEMELSVRDNAIIAQYSRLEDTLLHYAHTGDEHILANPSSTEKVLLTIANRRGVGNLDHPNTTSDVLDALAKRNRRLWEAMIDHPKVAPRTLAYIVGESGDDRISARIIEGKHVNAEVARAIVKASDDPDILRAIAAHPATPTDILDVLETDSRYAPSVWQNPSFPLDRLTGAIDWEHVQRSTANQHRIEALVSRSDAAAENINSILREYIKKKGDEWCTGLLLASPLASQESMCLCIHSRTLSKVVAGHPRASKDTLSRLISESDSADALIVVAKRADAPQEILKELSEHEDAEVRSAVATNKSTPKDILQILAEDKSALTRRCAFQALKERVGN